MNTLFRVVYSSVFSRSIQAMLLIFQVCEAGLRCGTRFSPFARSPPQRVSSVLSVSTCVCMYVHIWVFFFVCVLYLCGGVYLSVCLSVCLSVYMCVCMCVCLCL
jgi:hypothetical protein